jgi:glutathione S-transferase
MKVELIKSRTFPLCPYVHRAAIVLAEKGVPFERSYGDLAGCTGWFNGISFLGNVPPFMVGDGVFEGLERIKTRRRQLLMAFLMRRAGILAQAL